ncbi:ribosomal protection-like ABC-F family protein [Hazenella coriacea]|uniref:Macrolide transport system ATP-binding/permease protein n=1 Tax=Hazenella coriacea TaxID=1179467 RepID=A0A4V2UVB0_9BACL|nr:ABC-F family ATP-binding cassette domain-containing protein [Hazenella coriacea]TCS95107.1 macrolide transport system ATP-binding/permease protein [Hazenella coriacea]
MFILEAQKVKKWLGDRLLFSMDQLQIFKGDKIGIVGVNGAGKTTLLRCLSKEMPVDEGIIHLHGTMSWIHQGDGLDSDLEPPASGGEKTRRKIIKALAKSPALLLADEPTSHLDLESIQWLEKELQQYPGALLLISHDRSLLNAVCDKIIEVEQGVVQVYTGNYDEYRQQKEEQFRRQAFEYEQYVAEKRRLLDAKAETQLASQRVRKAPKRMGPSEARLHKWVTSGKKKKLDQGTKAIQSRINQLEEKEKPTSLPSVRFETEVFRPMESRVALRIDQVSKRIGARELFNSFTCQIPSGKKIALLGKNGVGKSTLLQMIVDQVPGVYLSPSTQIGYFRQNLTQLDEQKSILENVKEESPYTESLVRTVLARLLFRREDVYKPVGVLSGGERVKVALAKVFLSDCNCLLLDEPTNFLDVFTREELENVLRAYPGTILFASHDRQLIQGLAEHVLLIENKEAIYFSGTYQEWIQHKKDRSLSDLVVEEKQRLLSLENELSEVLGRLSTTPKGDISSQLEKRFQQLVEEIKQVKARM